MNEIERLVTTVEELEKEGILPLPFVDELPRDLWHSLKHVNLPDTDNKYYVKLYNTDVHAADPTKVLTKKVVVPAGEELPVLEDGWTIVDEEDIYDKPKTGNYYELENPVYFVVNGNMAEKFFWEEDMIKSLETVSHFYGEVEGYKATHMLSSIPAGTVTHKELTLHKTVKNSALFAIIERTIN